MNSQQTIVQFVSANNIASIYEVTMDIFQIGTNTSKDDGMCVTSTITFIMEGIDHDTLIVGILPDFILVPHIKLIPVEKELPEICIAELIVIKNITDTHRGQASPYADTYLVEIFTAQLAQNIICQHFRNIGLGHG